MSDTVKPYVEPSLAGRTREAAEALMGSAAASAPPQWHVQESLGGSFQENAAVLDVFRVATKYLYYTDFGKSLLKTWRDEFSESKTTHGDYEVQDFIHKIGHLHDFAGRNLGQLLKHYLSPGAIESGAWTHTGAWTSEDGVYLAHAFASFRREDNFLWIQEVSTGRGATHLAI